MTVPPPTTIVISYRQGRKADTPAGVPIEHFKSIPLPTTRWSTPGFVSFAAPCTRRPGQPLQLAPPDRWWVMGARSRSLVAYNLVSAVPFTGETIDERVTLPVPDRSMQAILEDFAVLDELVDQILPAFFADQNADATIRQDVLHSLGALIPDEVIGWYRLLAPDFFHWLEA